MPFAKNAKATPTYFGSLTGALGSMSTLRDQLHGEYGSQALENSSCFLCGASEESITAEHVFPRWLQSKFGLETETIHLLNGTRIQYNKLRIPCCRICNNEHLSRLESRIAKSVAAGFERATELDTLDWYYWAGKIFYSILRMEYSLILDRKDPAAGTILSADALRSHSNLHLFLQGIRSKHRFEGNPPYSVLICNLHDLENGRNYDFRDDLLHFTLAIRMGSIGVIVCFEDCGLTQSSYGKYVQAVDGMKLHPIQFDELYARTCYQLHITEGQPKFLTTSHTNGLEEATTTCFPSFRVGEWQPGEFFECLMSHVARWLPKNRSLDSYFQPPDRVTTWMTKNDGDLLILPLEQWEARPADAS